LFKHLLWHVDDNCSEGLGQQTLLLLAAKVISHRAP